MSIPTAYKCTTCQVLLQSAEELKIHHKCNWHRYNLKRKLVEMTPVAFDLFQRKLELLASADKVIKGNSHLKRHSVTSITSIKENESLQFGEATSTSLNNETYLKYPSTCYSLFDRHVAQTIDQNIEYMSRVFSFFIPDKEYLKDKEGLIQYLGDKLYEGRQCLYCNRPFKSLSAVRRHMISKGHTSIGTNTEEQEEELEPFYDYSESYKELNLSHLKKRDVAALKEDEDNDGNIWEDEDEDIAKLIGSLGLLPARINEYGNLILPGRREVPHRSIAYIYRQHLPTKRKDLPVRLALLHAKQLKALTEQDESTISRQRQARLLQTAHQRQTELWSRQNRRFDLRVGMKANKLNRKMKTAEKYFI